MFGYYVVPHWHIQNFRIAYWDKFGKPKINPKYDLVKLLPLAQQRSLSYQPGTMFDPDSKIGKNCARLCFGYNTPEEIYEGIRELAIILEKNQIL